MKAIVKRYAGFLITASAFAAFVAFFPAYREKSLSMIVFQAKTMLLVIPPIFMLLGLLDVWVPREQMMRFMGPNSGLKGGVLAFLLGSFAAGPLYGAFPVAAVLMKKGAGFANILIFLGAWSTTKIPMLLFEISALGLRFALSRLAIDIVGILVIAYAITKALPRGEIDAIFSRAEKS